MAKIAVYNSAGKKIKDKTVSGDIFAVTVKPELVQQVVVAMMANERTPWAHTKGRSDVKGGGRKPWRQKGTGRARHGSIRSPLWVGGGVTFGPTKERNFKKKINKKVKQQALFMVLSDKLANKSLFAIDDFKLDEIKTKKMIDIINRLPIKEKKSLIVLADKNEPVSRSARNLPNVKVVRLEGMKLIDLLNFPYLLMTEASVDLLHKKYSQTA
jgi:large subunit ribosomal protein L4